MAEEGEGKTSGAVFLAVAGGMLSQEKNLTDEACRCFMVVGIPYGNVNDSRVILKRYVCDHQES
jgi:Rad3-related DNA helicase